MTNDNNELESLKAKITELEGEVDKLTKQKPKRSNTKRFIISFLIVFVVLYVSIGVLQFISRH